jgi:ABC-type metal ion transport system substrate-binding protein
MLQIILNSPAVLALIPAVGGIIALLISQRYAVSKDLRAEIRMLKQELVAQEERVGPLIARLKESEDARIATVTELYDVRRKYLLLANEANEFVSIIHREDMIGDKK